MVQKKDGRRRTFTEEHRRKISAALKGQPKSKEHNSKISASMTGSNNPFFDKTHSEEAKAKIRAFQTGRTRTEETRAKLSAAWTPEMRAKKSAKMKLAMSGENNPSFGGLSEEHKAKISAARMGENNPMYGKTLSEEHKAKISAAWTPEMRAKKSAAQIGENNSSFNNWASREPYCPRFNNVLKERYRNSYGRICVYCGKSELFNYGLLSVHHIDGNKMQGCDDHDWFLVPLCRSCNSKGFERKPEYVFLFWLKDIERKHRSQ